MVEYYPWSNEVLNQCIIAAKQGEIPALDLELTAKCTGASCIYCDSKPNVCSLANPNELDFYSLQKVILDTKQRGLRFVYTCGLGEPLEDKKFWRLIDLLRENNITLSMFSNGVFITDLSIAARLKECGVNIILKMDTFNEERFDTILGRKGTAKKIYAARDLLLEVGYGLQPSGYSNLAFSIVPTSLSIDSIPEIIDFCHEHGVFASIGELEQAGEVIRGNLSDTLGISRDQVISLKRVADKYANGYYMRPICPCILSGMHIDDVGNCVVDRDTGLNCKWFLLQDPQTAIIGNVKTSSAIELYERAEQYRKGALRDNKQKISDLRSISYVFGGCGGNPKEIIEKYLKNYE